MDRQLDEWIAAEARRRSREQWEDGNSETPGRLVGAFEEQLRHDIALKRSQAELLRRQIRDLGLEGVDF